MQQNELDQALDLYDRVLQLRRSGGDRDPVGCTNQPVHPSRPSHIIRFVTSSHTTCCFPPSSSVLAEGEEKRDAGIAEALFEIGSTHHLMADFPTAIPYLKVPSVY